MKQIYTNVHRVLDPGLPDISIRQLEYLVAVADSPTWAKAAERVGVSASALSQGLAELERRVGVALFERAGRRRHLRSASRPVLVHARQVLALTRDLTDWSERVGRAEIGAIRLGLVDVAAVVHYPDTVRSFRVDHPDIEVHLSVASSAALLADLIDGTLDLVVCVEPADPLSGIELEPLMREPLFVFAPPGIEIGAAKDWGPWVLFPVGSHTRRLIADRLVAVGAPVSVVGESHQPEVLRQMVGLGFGWTVLPKHYAERGDQITDGSRLTSRQLVIARRLGAIPDPAGDELVARLKGAGL